MADDKAETGLPDRSKINFKEDYEVRYWVKLLDTTGVELRESVRRIGNNVEKVREDLRRRTLNEFGA